MPEECGLEQVRGNCAGVDRNERLVAARRVGVDGLGDELLAGSALALDEHGRAAGSDLRDEVEQLEHDVALADDVLERVALLEGALELHDLGLGLLLADRGADVGEQLLVVPGLLDEVRGAGADGIHDIADSSVGRDHDDRQLGCEALDARQKVETALAGKREVEQQEIVAVARQQIHAGGAVSGEIDREALEREQRLERVADAGLVVDDEDARVSAGLH